MHLLASSGEQHGIVECWKDEKRKKTKEYKTSEIVKDKRQIKEENYCETINAIWKKAEQLKFLSLLSNEINWDRSGVNVIFL